MVVYKQIMKNSFRAFISKCTIITVTYFGYHHTHIVLFSSLHQSPKQTSIKIIIRQMNDTTLYIYPAKHTL